MTLLFAQPTPGDGFEPSLAAVDAATASVPRGPTRMREAMREHMGDLRRLGIVDANCDVCSNRKASPVDRSKLRPEAAAWISFLCNRCEYTLSPAAEQARLRPDPRIRLKGDPPDSSGNMSESPDA